MLNDEQLQRLEALGEVQMLPDEIAIILGVDPVKLVEAIKSKQSKESIFYSRGKLTTTVKLRQALMIKAEEGDVRAIEKMLKMC